MKPMRNTAFHGWFFISDDNSSPRPESHQQSLRRLDQNFAQQLLHARGFRLVQSPDQPQARRIDDSSASEKNREAIPAYAEPMRLSCSDRIDQETPANWRQAQSHIPHDRINGKKMV